MSETVERDRDNASGTKSVEVRCFPTDIEIER